MLLLRPPKDYVSLVFALATSTLSWLVKRGLFWSSKQDAAVAYILASLYRAYVTFIMCIRDGGSGLARFM